jgi:hypothetical protein
LGKSVVGMIMTVNGAWLNDTEWDGSVCGMILILNGVFWNDTDREWSVVGLILTWNGALVELYSLGIFNYWTGSSPGANFSTTKPTLIELGSNPVLRCDIPVSIRLINGTAVGVFKTDLKKK